MVGIDDVSQKVNTLSHRKHSLVLFYLETDCPDTLMNDVADFPQFLFGGGKNRSVIAVSIEEPDAEPVLEYVVKVYREKQIAQSL